MSYFVALDANLIEIMLTENSKSRRISSVRFFLSNEYEPLIDSGTLGSFCLLIKMSLSSEFVNGSNNLGDSTIARDGEIVKYFTVEI